jgi:hypothetical protein
MKFLQFIILLIQRGSLSQRPVNFDAQRKEIMTTAIGSPTMIHERKENALKSYLLSTTVGYSLLSNLAYLKNSRHMNNMYFISDTYKVIYIRILKAASTSMLKEFLPLVDVTLKGVYFTDEQIDVLGFHYAHKNFKAAHVMYTKFALVRNPFERIVSVYLDLFDPTAVTFTYAPYWFGILKQDMTFKDFLKTIHKIPRSLLGPHFTSQHYILRKATDIKDLTIYRIEKDEEALNKFLGRFGIELPHLNKHPLGYDHRSYYDPETLGLVTALYQDDINSFGYQAEYNALQKYIGVH